MIALTSRISDTAHKLIIRERESRGVFDIVPSHGGIMMLLFSGERYTMKDMEAEYIENILDKIKQNLN